MHFYWELKKGFFNGFHGSGWGNTRPPPGTLRELKSLVHHLSADSLLPLSNMSGLKLANVKKCQR
jgi:hypothetical protein